MRHIWAIASKELRSYFSSTVALIFLAVFLGLVLFSFFWVDKFFARNIADVRPMFDMFPLLLIFLIAALTMRLWSDEQHVGTMEMLLTLPVPVHRLVLGKFLAGLLLVVLALLLTLGIPITVSMMGDLDWGPVIGGYLGALLLAAAYLAIGLCISSITEHQIVALIGTGLACLLFYLPGIDTITGLFGYDGAQVMRSLGTGSRFASIARGVIDLRDIVYYLSIVTFFLVLNTGLLHAKRWSRTSRTWKKRFNTRLAAVLVLGNVIAANIWLAPVASARADLTELNEYSLSPTTKHLLESLDEPLLLRAYISKKTHPLIEPLVPEIRDMLTEYGVAGGDKVRVEFVDPLGNDELEKEAEDYGVQLVNFEFAERHSSGYVNAYFSILIKYGDVTQVLDIRNLLEVDQRDVDDVRVSLRNFEYEVTKSIKKAVLGFRDDDMIWVSIGRPIKLTAYITPDSLPENYKELPSRLDKVVNELKKESNGKLEYEVVKPTTKAEMADLKRRYHFEPYFDLSSGRFFFMHLLLDVGGALQRVIPAEKWSETDIRDAILEGLRHESSLFIKTVGIVAPEGFTIPAQNQFEQPRQIPPPQGFDLLRKHLRDNYKVEDLDLKGGAVPEGVDVLIVAGPDHLSENQQYAIDQFLMRGGTTIVLDGRFRLSLRQEFRVNEVDTGLEELLKSYGVEVPKKLVLDRQSEPFAFPMVTRVGGRMKQRLLSLPFYPFFPIVKKDQMSRGDIITARIPAVVLQYASPVIVHEPAASKETDDEADKDSKADGKDGKAEDDGSTGADGDADVASEIKRTVLLRSTSDAWLQGTTDVAPNLRKYPKEGFGKPDNLAKEDKGPFDLAVALTGTFTSHFSEKGDPRLAKDAAKGKKDAAKDEQKKPDQTIKHSPEGTRLVVIGSSVFASDEGTMVMQLADTERHRNNMVLLENLVGWALEDTDLLSIRARGNYTRILEISEDSATKWEWINYGIVLFALLGVAGVSVVRRRTLAPIELLDRKTALAGLAKPDRARTGEEVDA